MEYQDDVMPHKKKAKPKPANKSKHKHVYEPCILEIPQGWYQKEHLRNGETKCVISSYCPVCGKLGGIDLKQWINPHSGNHYVWSGYNEEAIRELDPATRTLPTFCTDDPFAKFVELPTNEMKV